MNKIIKNIILICIIIISVFGIILTLNNAIEHLSNTDDIGLMTHKSGSEGTLFFRDELKPFSNLTIGYILILVFLSLVFISCLLYLIMSKFNKNKVFVSDKIKFIFVGLGFALAVLLTIIVTIYVNNKYLSINVEYSSPDNLHIDMDNFGYDEDNNVYYQIGVVYVSKPVDVKYESMGIYIPGDYLDCNKKTNGKYSCKLNNENKIGDYTSENAPIVMQLNTPGYSAQEAPTYYSYLDGEDYLEKGLIYIYAGCRGKENSDYEGTAPWGITDLKAAVRYLKYNDSALPGNAESIFAFGISASGGQATILGTSGDSELYEPYLDEIGALMKYDDGKNISDSIAGVMSWSGVSGFDIANEAYEWYMGQYVNTDTRKSSVWTNALSNDMSNSFANYINDLKLTDIDGNILSLNETSDGIYTSGSYYDYLLKEIENSLNNYLSDNYEKVDDMKKYVDSLNKNGKWVTFNQSKKTVSITSIKDFVTNSIQVKKDVGAFDDLNKDVIENKVFGTVNNSLLHFDLIMANLLEENKDKYSKYTGYNDKYRIEYNKDILIKDKMGIDIETRVNMYNPMYYLDDYYDGYKKSTVAKYFRIRNGINQSDIALTFDINLKLTLSSYETVKILDFETVWNQKHSLAERTGEGIENFINWIHNCIIESSENKVEEFEE